jgi:hypothetical protein
MSSPSHPDFVPGRRSGSVAIALAVGVALSAAIIALIHHGPLRQTIAYRYVEYPVQWLEVLFFCCGLGALASKWWFLRQEHLACKLGILPPWDGKPVPVARAAELLASVHRQPVSVHDTYLGRRLRGILEFLRQRQSASELDAQLRNLSELDALHQENSFALIRFITWAIPILGFLGTVVGITGAISGVTPEVLEESMSAVTDGLAEAFDSTALALGLTMILMFLSFLIDRQEQSLLQLVDGLVDRDLAHRFQREQSDGGLSPELIQRGTQALSEVIESLVRKQAEVWAAALQEPERRSVTLVEQIRDQFTDALGKALDQTIDSYAQRLALVEQQSLGHMAQLSRQLAEVSHSVRGIVESVATQSATLERLLQDGGQLLAVQNALQQNLETLARVGDFEEAVHSLTAAVHLLTARAAGQQPRLSQGKAA